MVNGFKRTLAAALLALIGLINASGSATLMMLVPFLEWVAAGLGTVGVIHAGISMSTKPGVFKKYILATLASLIAIAQLIPALHPWVEILRQIAALIGAAAVGQYVGERQIRASSNARAI